VHPDPRKRRFGLLLFNHYVDQRRVAVGHDGSGGQYLWAYPRSGLVVTRLRDATKPYDHDAHGFGEVADLGAQLDEALVP
jgi:hypothetical protein